MNSNPHLPAILGGEPVIPTGLPDWPISDDSALQVFQEIHRSGDWGKYSASHSLKLIEQLKRLYSSEHILLTSSGTSAIELALRGLNVSIDDEVILAAYDFKANFTNISLLGGIPVLVDIQEGDVQLDVSQIEAAITDKTKAIIASHLHGGLVDMENLVALAKKHQISIIEDCCQVSPCASIKDHRIGCFGDVACLSFGGSKLLSAGRGGAVISHQDQIAQRIKLYQERGNSAYPLSEIQAALLVPQVESLPSRHKVRIQFAAKLEAALTSESGLKLLEKISESVTDYYKMGMWYDGAQFAELSRENFCDALRAEGIPIDPGFLALHRIHAKRRFRGSNELNNADKSHQQLVILHHPYMLGGEISVERFLQALDKIKDHATIVKQHFS